MDTVIMSRSPDDQSYSLIDPQAPRSITHLDTDWYFKLGAALLFMLNCTTDSITLVNCVDNSTQQNIQYIKGQWTEPGCNILLMCLALACKSESILPNSRCTQILASTNIACPLITLSTPLWQHLSIMANQDLLHFPMSIAALSLLSLVYQRTTLVNPYSLSDEKRCAARACFGTLLFGITIAECAGLYSATRKHPPHETILADLISSAICFIGTLVLLCLGSSLLHTDRDIKHSTTPCCY